MNLYAVLQGDEFGIELVILYLLHLAGLGQGLNQRSVVGFFLQRLNLFGFHFLHPTEEVLLGRQDVVFLVGGEDGYDEVGVGQLLHQLIDHIHGSHGDELVHGVVLPLDASHGLVVDEVAHTFIHVRPTLHLVAVQICTFHLGEEFRLESLIL